MGKLLTTNEYAAQVGRDRSVVFRLITQGRIPAVKVGNQWCIEEGTPYPADNRVKNGKYKNWRKTGKDGKENEV